MLGHTFLHISPCQFFHIGTHPLGRGRDYFFITHRFQTGDLLLLRGFLRLLFGVKFRFALGFSRLMLRTLFFFIFCGGRLCRIPLLSRLLFPSRRYFIRRFLLCISQSSLTGTNRSRRYWDSVCTYRRHRQRFHLLQLKGFIILKGCRRIEHTVLLLHCYF